ncbi:MAG: GHKL domain-containing protein [Deltaproteobacteria bacterium]|nr:GHKL domain-containing protein [Deltaproteobacteria bacterium]
MLDSFSVLAVLCLYMGFLFLTALWVERRSSRTGSPLNHSLIYSLSLAVYCTGWTYYGSVGKAVTSGLLFLPIYLGPTIAITLWWIVLRKLVRIKTTHHITSIADFISARYDKSLAVGALATLIAMFGYMPYIALQFKAIFSTFAIITSEPGAPPTWISSHLGSVTVGLMILFTIVLGVRRPDATERHPGLIMAIAVECLVKLVAFLAAGIFVTYFMFDGFTDILGRLPAELPDQIRHMWDTGHVWSVTWMTYLVLAMSAIMFLPRQFHVSVIENFDEEHIRTAMWFFPLYMLLINLFVFPIAMGGLLKGYSHLEADTFVLSLPLHSGHRWLSLMVFIGGVSAATGMIMISSITVSTMITNHFLLPMVGWIPWLSFLRRRLLHCRWAALAAVILIGYWFEREVGESYMLVNIGMIAFAAAFQFAPAILGGILWRRANKTGALLGLGAGFLIWFYTLLLPAYIRSGWISYTLLDRGPWGISLLRPEQLFGMSELDPLAQAVFWSMIFNIGLYVLGSLVFKQSESEQSLAEDFVGALTTGPALVKSAPRESNIDLTLKRKTVLRFFGQFFSEDDALSMTEKCIREAGLEDKERISISELSQLHNEVERLLAGSVGAATAHRMLAQSNLFSEREARDLSEVYSEILASLKVTSEDLKQRVDYYQEREALLAQHAAELEAKVRARTRELEVAQEELIKRERLSVLGQLTGVVSHELRNPLGVISFSAYYLKRNIKAADEKISKHLNRIEEQVGHCDLIIDELLEYTRGSQSSLVQGEINAWLEQILDQIRIPEGVTVQRALSRGLPSVRFDGEKLRRVVINLMENALQAVRSRMETETGQDYVPTVKVSTSNFDGAVRIHIEDNGVGMDLDTASRAFEPLFTTKPRGTGLGLAVVKKIVAEHGGTVALSSRPSRGTTVAVTLQTDQHGTDADSEGLGTEGSGRA